MEIGTQHSSGNLLISGRGVGGGILWNNRDTAHTVNAIDLFFLILIMSTLNVMFTFFCPWHILNWKVL